MEINIPDDFIETCRDMPQWSLDTELFANIGYNCLQLVRFFIEDIRLENHADVNADKGRAFYLCRSEQILHYLIVEGGLKMTDSMYQDIIDHKVLFPEKSLELFTITESYNKLNNKYPCKVKNKSIKI